MDKCILVQHLSSINSVISETFKTTQRIKLTCLDVSTEYIVFGASSGGIYIFKREPCEFLKIIPSKEGSAIKISICPNGKHLTIASSKGLIIILEDFLGMNVRPLVHNEHEGSTVTAIKWHGNAIYSGDDTGRVAIFSLGNLLTIFQTPFTTLMHLDSSIVQIDAYSNYLLVSTKTRTYLCDTEKECFKQIGKKLRDGNFGACFFNVVNKDVPDMYQSFKGGFKTVKENEHFTTTVNHSDVKIYCARPGARLWEANFEATVRVTHQFRDCLNQNLSDILHLEYVTDTRMNMSTFEDVAVIPKNFNFGQIYPVSHTFVFTYDNDSIYFFDPENSKLAFWSNCFKNIKEIVVLGSVIFIWQDNLQISVISVDLLEEIIIRALLNKQYYFCAELCTTYYDYVIKLIEVSKKIHLISILKSKLLEIEATDILEKLIPILNVLENFNKKHTVGKRLTNGMVLIENSHGSLDCDNVYIPESVRNFENSSLDSEKNISDDTDEPCREVTGEFVTEHLLDEKAEPQKRDVEESIDLLALYKQFQLNKTHKNAELTESTLLMDKLNLDKLLLLFQDFIKYVANLENTDATLWCKEQFIKQASKKCLELKTINMSTSSFLSEAFLESFKSRDLGCECNFPLPKVHKNCPEYYDLGCKLLDHCKSFDSYLINVPYMHKYILSKTKKLSDIIPNLPLLVQFSDGQLFEQFLTLFTYDTWDEVIKLNVKLRKEQKCLNCGSSIEVEDACSWSSLGMLMIKSIGPQNTLKLLKRYSQCIPNGSLDARFYHCCILASTFDQPSLAVNFMDKISSENVLTKFGGQVEKFLQRNYMGCQSQPLKSASSVDKAKCAYCDIPLHGPILSESKKCDYGHNFHSLCFAHNKGICNVCSNV